MDLRREMTLFPPLFHFFKATIPRIYTYENKIQPIQIFPHCTLFAVLFEHSRRKNSPFVFRALLIHSLDFRTLREAMLYFVPCVSNRRRIGVVRGSVGGSSMSLVDKICPATTLRSILISAPVFRLPYLGPGACIRGR